MAVLLAGCASPPSRVIAPPPTIPLESQANVRVGETVKAYPVNRYVDPANPRVMHERSVVYRVEQDARWRLASNASQQVLVGNTVTQSPMDAASTAARADAATAATRMRRVEQEQKRLQSTVQALGRQIVDVERTQTRLREQGMGAESQEMAALNKELQALQAKQEEMNAEIVRLRQASANPSPVPAVPSSPAPGQIPAGMDGLTEEERIQADEILQPR